MLCLYIVVKIQIYHILKGPWHSWECYQGNLEWAMPPSVPPKGIKNKGSFFGPLLRGLAPKESHNWVTERKLEEFYSIFSGSWFFKRPKKKKVVPMMFDDTASILFHTDSWEDPSQILRVLIQPNFTCMKYWAGGELCMIYPESLSPMPLRHPENNALFRQDSGWSPRDHSVILTAFFTTTIWLEMEKFHVSGQFLNDSYKDSLSWISQQASHFKMRWFSSQQPVSVKSKL